MLMALGPVIFDHIRNSLTETSSESSASIAEHAVVQAAPVYEAMGMEGTTFTLTGAIHPEAFGGLGNIDTLRSIQAGNIPMPLMRGDFKALGWVLIKTVSENSSFIDYSGVGRKVEFTVEVIVIGTPSGGAAGILGLF